MNHHQYLTLVQRYKELGVGGGAGGDSIPFDIDSHISEIDTGKIDADYMNSRFDKYLKVLQGGDEQAKEATLADLQRSFASLSQEEQKIAEIFLRDIQRGDVQIDTDRSFRDYLSDYKAQAKNKEMAAFVACLGVDQAKLIALMSSHVTPANLNEYGRFDALRETVDMQKAQSYFEGLEGKPLTISRVRSKVSALLSAFILEGGIELKKAS